MSFDIFGYKSSAEEFFSQAKNKTSDDLKGEAFSSSDLEFIDRLLVTQGFTKKQNENSINYELSPIQIEVSSHQISVSSPYWENSKMKLRKVLILLNVIQEKTGIIFYNPQLGKLASKDPDQALRKFSSTIKKIKRTNR
jgi:hypothetical protein